MTEQRERLETAQNQQFERSALSAAKEEAVRQDVTENANLLRELRRAGIDTDKYDWLENVLGPEIAESHAIGNRGPQYEQEVKWGMLGKADQTIAERNPGRLCKGTTREIMQGTHRRNDKSAESPLTTDEKRVVQSAFEAAANHKSLAVKSRGIRTIGETTVTARREVTEESSSWSEKAGGLLD